MHSRLFVRVGGALRRGRIRSEEDARPASAPMGLCPNRSADHSERGRNCPDCGLPLRWIPGGVVTFDQAMY